MARLERCRSVGVERARKPRAALWRSRIAQLPHSELASRGTQGANQARRQFARLECRSVRVGRRHFATS